MTTAGKNRLRTTREVASNSNSHVIIDMADQESNSNSHVVDMGASQDDSSQNSQITSIIPKGIEKLGKNYLIQLWAENAASMTPSMLTTVQDLLNLVINQSSDAGKYVAFVKGVIESMGGGLETAIKGFEQDESWEKKINTLTAFFRMVGGITSTIQTGFELWSGAAPALAAFNYIMTSGNNFSTALTSLNEAGKYRQEMLEIDAKLGKGFMKLNSSDLRVLYARNIIDDDTYRFLGVMMNAKFKAYDKQINEFQKALAASALMVTNFITGVNLNDAQKKDLLKVLEYIKSVTAFLVTAKFTSAAFDTLKLTGENAFDPEINMTQAFNRAKDIVDSSSEIKLENIITDFTEISRNKVNVDNLSIKVVGKDPKVKGNDAVQMIKKAAASTLMHRFSTEAKKNQEAIRALVMQK